METFKTVAIIVAHPDDETLWAGGLLLNHPEWDLYVASLCRGEDPDRAPKFFNVLNELGAQGKMGNMDDSPELLPLDQKQIQQHILELLPKQTFDLVITHHPKGEYTRHLRHEETSQAVISLWNKGSLTTRELWCFAYEDGGRAYYPRPVLTAKIILPLDKETWLNKYRLITEIYGFESASWEAQTTPQTEAFWQFTTPKEASWFLNQLRYDESIGNV
jgi:LmbE family N-acetylglucosaminyl deacetylase